LSKLAVYSLILLIFFVLSFGFFHQSIDNGFWHGDDFVALRHSLEMQNQTESIFSCEHPYKFQPLIYWIYHFLFIAFEFDVSGYMIINILLHGLNSFLVLLLVNILLRDRTVALLSSLLFLFTVGSYGKSVMIVSGLDDLIITTLTLLTMIFYFKNELQSKGRILSPWFLLTFIFFALSMLIRSTSFSIIGAFLAFNYIFRVSVRKHILSSDFIILSLIAISFLIIKITVFHYTPSFYTRYPGPLLYIYYAAKNVINYLVRMVFPIHTSHLVSEAGVFVRFVYSFATTIRILIALTIVSYSVFGFIFGNRTIRFFIAWTYIMVIPFCFFQFPSDWLNIRHLYLVSVGFTTVISAGAVYCSRLISHHRYRRIVPFSVPIFFIFLSRFIVGQLDTSYENKVKDEKTIQYKTELVENFDQVEIKEGKLVLKK
jgi:hypothetical protein